MGSGVLGNDQLCSGEKKHHVISNAIDDLGVSSFVTIYSRTGTPSEEQQNSATTGWIGRFSW